ncbi:ABC transporter permease [Gemmatimonas aurantiaca]|uniref:ABC transporter permease n=1 Tax=Gemmatimonas aurantiaca TaxID=173480 RepID=UPI00301C54A1
MTVASLDSLDSLDSLAPVQPAPVRPVLTWNRPALDRRLILPGAMLAVMILLAAFGPWIAPFDPAAPQDMLHAALQTPGPVFRLGTDSASRDLLSRVLYGARTSLTIAAIGTLTALLGGVAWATLARLCGGAWRAMLLALSDAFRSIPRLLVLLAAGAVAGGALAPYTIAMTMGCLAMPFVCRVIDAELRQLAARPWNEAAHALGASPFRILSHHLLPHLLPVIVSLGVVLLGECLAAEAALGVLGLGIPEPAVSWGRMIQDALPDLARAWWPLVVPCLALLVTMLATSTLAEQLNSRSSYHD